MKINELQIISTKFRELLVKQKKYSNSDIKNLDNLFDKSFKSISFSNLFRKGFLSNFKGNSYELNIYYSDLVSLLIKSGLPVKYITGKKKYEKYNKHLNIDGSIGVYSTIIILSLARRLILPEKYLYLEIKDIWGNETTINVLNKIDDLEPSYQMYEETNFKNNYRDRLFSLLEQNLKVKNIKLNIYFKDKIDNPFELKFIDKTPKIFLNDKQISDFNNLKINQLKKNLVYLDKFQFYYEKVKKSVSSNAGIDLVTLYYGFLYPLYDFKNKNIENNIFSLFSFKILDLVKINSFLANKLGNINLENIITINKLAIDLDLLSEFDEDGEYLIQQLEDTNEEEYLSRNIIYFGPPGTGKSYKISTQEDNLRLKPENIIRVTFHPEFSYFDFVGQYKPVVGYELVNNKILDSSNNLLSFENLYKKPIVYYDFVPSAFTKAIVKALTLIKENSKENVLLLIEEINRGNCSAIFGDIFQLLDRINDIENHEYGYSQYPIEISTEMKNFIMNSLNWSEIDWNKFFPSGFKLPKNLFIYATMNTSDQSLFPMDSAFKRRWSMNYINIDYEIEELQNLYLPEPYNNIKWLDFIKIINTKIVDFTNTDDKQIGQWFLGFKNKGDEKSFIPKNIFIGKVLSYLWFDVFRQEPSYIFKDNIKTYDDIKLYYEKGILKKEIFIDSQQVD